MNAYEQKRQDKLDRLTAAAEKARKESDATHKAASQMYDAIPFGQPILVGHHSENRDRNYRSRAENKLRKSFELNDKAAELERRAEAMENSDVISSDDPDATTKLAAKIAELEKRQELMKSSNKLVKKNDREGLAKLGLSEKAIDGLFTPDCFGGLGFAKYALTNNGANIRRLKQRIVDLEKMSKRRPSETTINDVTIVGNVDDNRVQIFFPSKPDEPVRKELRSSGFIWAPSIGAWQRHYSDWAIQLAKNIVEKYY
jgi:hypothetical protein